MRQNVKKRLVSLSEQDARNQTQIAVVLMAVIPALSLFYVGKTIGAASTHLSPLLTMLIFALTVAVAIPGFLILRRYPNNILRLRQYVADLAEGTLPEKISLIDPLGSDDILFIETNFNIVLEEMRHRIHVVEDQLHREHSLRETIEQQQQVLIEAERHRAMIQTLGATCHHIGQPATVLQVRMELLKDMASSQEEIEEIEGCIEAVQSISTILHQLQAVSEFRTVPYIHHDDEPDEVILAIEPTAATDKIHARKVTAN